MTPYTCSYVEQLASQFRLAWVPVLADWDVRDGFRRLSNPPSTPMSIECEDSDLAALIDVTSCRVNRVRVVVPQKSGSYQRFFRWLPAMSEVFTPGRYFAPGVEDGDSFNDRSQYGWRFLTHKLQVVADEKQFASDEYQDVIAAGGQVIRIEVPGNDLDFSAHSIQRTDITATLLEHVIGLLYGLIAVNRSRSTVHFNGFAPIKPGHALIVEGQDSMLRVSAPKVG